MSTQARRAVRATVLLPATAVALLLGCASTTSGPNPPAPSTADTIPPSPAVTPTSVIVPVDATGFPDPCKLVTREEADATIGTKFPAGEIIENEDEQYFGIGRRCTYHPPQVYNGPKLDVQIRMNPSDDVWAAFMADIGQILGGAEDVPNLGDKAYLFRKDHDCFVIKGRFVMAINLLYGMVTPPDVDERLLALCRTAVARIPA
jgi:hypothetical protein